MVTLTSSSRAATQTPPDPPSTWHVELAGLIIKRDHTKHQKCILLFLDETEYKIQRSKGSLQKLSTTGYEPAFHPCIFIQADAPVASVFQLPCVPHQLHQSALFYILVQQGFQNFHLSASFSEVGVNYGSIPQSEPALCVISQIVRV